MKRSPHFDLVRHGFVMEEAIVARRATWPLLLKSEL